MPDPENPDLSLEAKKDEVRYAVHKTDSAYTPLRVIGSFGVHKDPATDSQRRYMRVMESSRGVPEDELEYVSKDEYDSYVSGNTAELASNPAELSKTASSQVEVHAEMPSEQELEKMRREAEEATAREEKKQPQKAPETSDEIVLPSEWRKREEESYVSELPTSRSLESTQESLAKSKTRKEELQASISELSQKLDEAKNAAVAAINGEDFAKAQEKTQEAAGYKDEINKTKGKVRTTEAKINKKQAELKFLEEALSPANILDLKQKIDSEISKRKSDRERTKNFDPIPKWHEALEPDEVEAIKRELVDQYLQSGGPREDVETLVKEVYELLDKDYKVLEANLNKKNTEPTQDNPDDIRAEEKHFHEGQEIQAMVGGKMVQGARIEGYPGRRTAHGEPIVNVLFPDGHSDEFAQSLVENWKTLPKDLVVHQGKTNADEEVGTSGEDQEQGGLPPAEAGEDSRTPEEKEIDDYINQLRSPQVSMMLKERLGQKLESSGQSAELLENILPRSVVLDTIKRNIVIEHLETNVPEPIRDKLPDFIIPTLMTGLDLDEKELETMLRHNQHLPVRHEYFSPEVMERFAGTPQRIKGGEPETSGGASPAPPSPSAPDWGFFDDEDVPSGIFANWFGTRETALELAKKGRGRLKKVRNYLGKTARRGGRGQT